LALLVILILFSLKSLFVVALVNNFPISRLAVIRELEKQGGDQVLESLINERLILQEAAKKKVSVLQEEIDSEIAVIEENLQKQGTTLEAALSLQGQSKNDLIKAIKLKLLIQKIIADKLTVNEEEVKTYYTNNLTALYKGKSLETVKDEIKNLLQQQKLNQEYQTWIQEINEKAKIRRIFSFSR